MKRTVLAILIMPCLAFAAPQANSTIDLDLLDSLLRVKSVSRDKPNLRIFIGEKGHALIRLVAHGKGGHSSRPWALDNPISKLCEGYAVFKSVWEAEAPGTGTWRTIASPTILTGGETSNVVPDDASMTLSCRFTTMGDYRLICDCLRRTTGCEVQAPKKPHRLPVTNREDDLEIAALYNSLRTTIPNLRLGRMSAATDATYYVHLGLPIVIFTADGCEPHASRERGSISSMNLYAEALTRHLAERQ